MGTGKNRMAGEPFLRLVNPMLVDLNGKIWEEWQDLALVLCMKAGGTDEYSTIGDVSDEVCGEERDRMLQEARKNLEESCILRKLGQAIAEMSRELSGEDEWDFDETVFGEATVITTQDNFCGASAITLPSVQEQLRQRYGSYYIIPSSVHEVIVLPHHIGNGMRNEYLRSMIMDINISEVAVKDWLGDHAYICEDGVIRSAEVAG